LKTNKQFYSAMRLRNEEWTDEELSVREGDGEWETIAPGVERMRLPDNDPVRKIVTGRRNNRVGKIFSHKMGVHVAYESDHSGKMADLLDVHHLVPKFWGEPETLRIKLTGDRIDPFGNESMIYTPDYLVPLSDVPVRFEFKMLSDIRPKKPKKANDVRGWLMWEEAKKTRRRLRIARQAYQDAGLVWALMTDVDLKAIADEETVFQIVANSGVDIDEDDRDRLLAALRHVDGKCLPLGECEALIKNSEFPRANILARIPERLLRIDLTEEITTDTLVHLLESPRE
jgi:hypothetical protein